MSTFPSPPTLTRPPSRAGAFRALAVVGLFILGACSSSAASGETDSGRPDGASGGAAGPGTGGQQGASGGSSGTGGSVASGGAPGSAGAPATGGAPGSGGAPGTGGASGTGGRPGTGGTTSGSGGRGGVNGTGGNGGAPPATGGASGGGEFGFTYRKPGATDVDWLCTFRQAGIAGHVYVRLDQTGTMVVGVATIPVYTPVLAQLSVGGVPSNLANVQYDYGGGHHNDSLRFDYQGKSYKYYHSSFGFGFRCCQPMDCLDVYATGAAMPLTGGCTAARALPEICVPIKSDGTHDPLVDQFMKCPGDSVRLSAAPAHAP